MGGQDDLDKSLKAIMAAKRDELGEPPTPEELLAYRDGRLDPPERRRLEDRIAVFPDAARTLADLAAFPDIEPAPGTPELSDQEIGARWQAFRRRLPEHPDAQPSLPGEGSEGKRIDDRTWRRAPRLRLAAAVLTGLGVGSAAGFFGGRLSREAPGSAINVRIAELTPEEEGGTRSAAMVLEMPGESEELVLVLVTRAEEDFPDYEAEIVDQHGARIWSRQGLRPTAMGTFQVSFRHGALTAGTLQIRLFGREGETRTPLGTYGVQLLAEEDSR